MGVFVSILATDAGSGQPNSEKAPEFLICPERVDQYLLERDSTAGLFSALKFMDNVEDWVLQRLGEDDASVDEVRARLRRLSEIIYQYRQQIPPDNHAFLQVLAWLNTSVVVYVVDYLTQHQVDFMAQLLDYSKANSDIDVNASLMVKRVRALYRARLLDRIYSPENVDYVMRILLRGCQ